MHYETDRGAAVGRMSLLVDGAGADAIEVGGMLPMANPSIEGLKDFVTAEIVRWSKVVEQAGLAGTQ